MGRRAIGDARLGAVGVPFWALLVLVPLLMLPLGYAIERLLIQRVFDSRDRHVTTLLANREHGVAQQRKVGSIRCTRHQKLCRVHPQRSNESPSRSVGRDQR